MRTVCRQPVLLLQADAADRAAALYEDHGRFTFKFKLTSLVQRCSVLSAYFVVHRCVVVVVFFSTFRVYFRVFVMTVRLMPFIGTCQLFSIAV